jgi:hypothetical protein
MRERGLTLQPICETLNAEHVPTPRGGAFWRPASLPPLSRRRHVSPAAECEAPPREIYWRHGPCSRTRDIDHPGRVMLGGLWTAMLGQLSPVCQPGRGGGPYGR